MPMTSPVDFISGPSRVSTLANLSKGKTASFTAQCFSSVSPVIPRSSRLMPSINLVASLAKGTPVALLTKGTVLDARGFTSRM